MDEMIGHNAPPSMIETAQETAQSLSGWLAENPVIETEEQARQAKLLIDRGRLCHADLRTELKSKTEPLLLQAAEITESYKPSKSLLERVVDELKGRVTTFLRVEEEKREKAAQEAARKAEEAERIAREAERIEQEAIASARAGELGVDIAQHTSAADAAFRAFEKADHKAAIAERGSHVRLGGGFRRAISLRERETLVVTDGMKAIASLGFTDKIIDAIISDARAYRKLRGQLPPGVESVKERKV